MQRLGVAPTVDPTAHLTDTRLGRYTQVGPRVRLHEVEMGDYSYVEHDSDIAYARIGKFCSIAALTRLNPGNHPMWRASQSHFTYRAAAYFDDAQDEDDFFAWRRAHPVTLGHDVWVGHGAIILPGRSVGTGSVVAGGAVVSRDVPAYAVVAGVPARVVKMRFPEPVAARLQALGWWDWDHARLRAALEDFRSLPIEAFLDRHGG
ncbi:MAG: chloramphenicol acetyltransferase [Rhizobiales bacterium]|nr:chloramphenicol acetyltransferase [Hyphomicrobiales bacterium]